MLQCSNMDFTINAKSLIPLNTVSCCESVQRGSWSDESSS